MLETALSANVRAIAAAAPQKCSNYSDVMSTRHNHSPESLIALYAGLDRDWAARLYARCASARFLAEGAFTTLGSFILGDSRAQRVVKASL